jgi:hypothetical protein
MNLCSSSKTRTNKSHVSKARTTELARITQFKETLEP